MTDEKKASASPVQVQARALADPTRYRIFRHVVDAPEPPRVASMSRRFGLSESAVRQHLAKLRDAGLLIEEQAPQKGPGRPALQYRIAAGTQGAWRTPGPYEELALFCLQVLRTGDSPRQVGAAAGRTATARMTPTDGLDRLEAEMGRRGFEPRRVDRGQFVDLVLGRCPYEAAALADPDVVCELHRGLAEGIVEKGGVEVTDLVVHDPRRGGCRLRTRASSNGSGDGATTVRRDGRHDSPVHG